MTREEIISNLLYMKRSVKEDTVEDITINEAIKALEQKPFINKPCVSENVCEHDKQMFLDKIRAEIDEQYDRVHPYNISCAEGLEMALEIIYKYKESEGE